MGSTERSSHKHPAQDKPTEGRIRAEEVHVDSEGMGQTASTVLPAKGEVKEAREFSHRFLSWCTAAFCQLM